VGIKIKKFDMRHYNKLKAKSRVFQLWMRGRGMNVSIWLSTLMYIFAFIVCFKLFSNIFLAFVPHLNFPMGDYVSVLERFQLYLSGKLNFFEFVGRKHVDHNHFIVYLFSAIDIWLFNGQQSLLFYVSIIAHCLTFCIFAIIAYSLKLNRVLLALFTIFIGCQIFNMFGAETWIYPFQMVLSLFRLVFLAGLALFCFASVQRQGSPLVFSVAGVLLLIASISHGSGLFVFLSVIAVALFTRSNYGMITAAVATGIFLCFEVFFPPRNNAFLQLTEVISSGLVEPIYYTANLLGAYFFFGSNEYLASVIGIVFISLYFCLALWIVFMERDKWQQMFFIALAGFSLISAFSSVIINLYYMPERGFINPWPQYFHSSRYLVTTSGFWIGLFGAVFFLNWRHSILIGAASAMIGTSALSAITLTEDWNDDWRDTYHRGRANSLFFNDNDWRNLNQENLTKALAVPLQMSSQARSVLEFQENNNLGPFSKDIQHYASKRVVEISDDNWERGIAKDGNAFLIANTKTNIESFTDNMIVMIGDQIRQILSVSKTDGASLAVFVDGPPLMLQTERTLSVSKDIQHYASKRVVEISDDNWERGIAKDGYSFLINNIEPNRKLFLVGQKLSIGGNVRIIRTLDQSDKRFIRVYIAGESVQLDTHRGIKIERVNPLD
jgi:hypothetical protein